MGSHKMMYINDVPIVFFNTRVLNYVLSLLRMRFYKSYVEIVTLKLPFLDINLHWFDGQGCSDQFTYISIYPPRSSQRASDPRRNQKIRKKLLLNCGQTLKIKILITCVGIKPTEINQWVGWTVFFFSPLLDCIQVLVVWGVGKRAWSVVLCGQDEYPVVHDGVSLSSADHEGSELCEN